MAKPLKRLPTSKKEIFVTFDDGPCDDFTSQVLSELRNLEIKATFFVVGESAKKNPRLLAEIVSEGHGIGNHSWDHAYWHYFRNKDHLKNWVLDSQHRLADILGFEPVAFRSPAGIVTPPLQQAMEELGIPWVHWNKRFFDTNVPLTFTLPFMSAKAGDILLLHDRQKKIYQSFFLAALVKGFRMLRDKGFDFQPLRAEKFSDAR